VAVILVLLAVVVLAVGSPGVGLLFVLAIAPGSFLLWHFYHADKYKRESMRLLGGTFLVGALFFLVAAMVESAYSEPSSSAGIVAVFAYYLFGIGLVEELAKFLTVRIFPYRSRHFDEPMDGIVFGVAAALGFATVENVLYVLQNGLGNGIIRAIVSVPGHAFWGAILGFYLGEAKVRGRPRLALYGLAIAVFLHGLFDTISTILPGLVAIFAMLAVVWIVYFKVVKKEIAEAETESPYRPDIPPGPSRNTPSTTSAERSSILFFTSNLVKRTLKHCLWASLCDLLCHVLKRPYSRVSQA
jgi:RsiW-degrading membrane proteinase PrsW (M82 family)